MKKPFYSYLTSWTIKILLGFILLMALGLLMLSTLSGTSESHRLGLQQAFSDSLNADVTIGKIDEFNVMPQLKLKVSKIHGIFNDTKNEFMADHLNIAFGFADLALRRNRIDDFQIDNFRFSKDSGYDVRIDHAGIEQGKSPSFMAKGQYDERDFDFTMPLTQTGGTTYSFEKNSLFKGHYKPFAITGELIPATGKDQAALENIELSEKGKVVATGHGMRDEHKEFKLFFDCEKNKAVISAEGKAAFHSLEKIRFISFSKNCLQ